MDKLKLFPSLVYIQKLELDTKEYLTFLYSLKQQSLGRYISNKGGWQSNELLENPHYTYLINKIQNECFKLYNTQYKLIELWANISPKNAYNQIHTHSFPNNNAISGILYLKVPINSGDLIFYDPSNISRSFPLTPKEKEIIFFDSTLPHSVDINLSHQDRISLAFNLLPLSFLKYQYQQIQNYNLTL